MSAVATMQAERSVDVAVVGGGPGGCATALELVRRGVSDVLLLEAGTYDAPRVGESIPPDTRMLLDRLGVLEGFLEEEHDRCYGSCSSWGADELGYNDFLLNPRGTGWHLDRRRFDAFLAARTAARGVEVRTGARVLGTRTVPGGVRLELREAEDTRRTVRAGFVVDATGHRAAIAKALGAKTRLHDRLICVYGFFELAHGSRFRRLTLLEAVEEGWWYAARLPGDRLAVAFAGDGDVIRRRGLRRAAPWRAFLSETRHLRPALAGCRFVPGSMEVWPVFSSVLDPPAGERWLAVGDAASAYDPISSQGIYKALLDGTEAGAALAGEDGGIGGYAEAVHRRFTTYLAHRRHFYDLETRWPDAPFWRRRRDARLERSLRASR